MKQHHRMVSIIRESRCSLAGCLCRKTVGKALAGGYASSQGLTGKEPASEVTHMVASRIQFIRAVPHPMGPFLGQPKSIRPSR